MVGTGVSVVPTMCICDTGVDNGRFLPFITNDEPPTYCTYCVN